MTSGEPARAHTWSNARQYDVGGRFDDDISRALTQIISDLGPGAALPNERDLAVTIGVSRNALRDRIRLLESAGILSRRQGSGTYVQERASTEGLATSLDLLVATDQMSLSDLHEVRIALEVRAVELACGSAAAEVAVLDAMQECIDGIERDFGKLEVAEHDLEFHRLLFVASGSPALQLISGALQSVFRRAIYLGTRNWVAHGVGRHVAIGVHQDILDAVRARDTRAAVQAMHAHFMVYASILKPGGPTKD